MTCTLSSHELLMSASSLDIGWLLDVSIEKDQAILWIKTTDERILKIVDKRKERPAPLSQSSPSAP